MVNSDDVFLGFRKVWWLNVLKFRSKAVPTFSG